MLSGASQRLYWRGQIQGEFCLILAPSGSRWCQPWWETMTVPSEHHSGHLGPFSWIQTMLMLPLSRVLAQFWIFCLSITFRFLSTLAPEIGKEKLKEQKLLSVLGNLGVIVHTKMSLLGQGCTSFYTLNSALTALSEVQLCFPNSTLLLRRVAKVWPFPHFHWFRDQKRQDWIETESCHEVPNSVPS